MKQTLESGDPRTTGVGGVYRCAIPLLFLLLSVLPVTAAERGMQCNGQILRRSYSVPEPVGTVLCGGAVAGEVVAVVTVTLSGRG
jgi:hypothetical protein